MSDVADNVRKAADHIEKYGLHKGGGSALPKEVSDSLTIAAQWDKVREDGVPCCAAGALWAYLGWNSTADYGLAGFLKLDHPANVFTWNDAPERTPAEVVDALRRYADHIDKESPDE